MELSQLHYFAEAAKSEHISKTAEVMHIAQPSLTKSIKNLQTELGVPLFVPKGRNVVLTEYGRYFYKKLVPLLDGLDALPAQLRRMAQLENETMHVNVLSASSIVTQAVIEYKRKHKEVSFQLVQNEESELYDIGVSTKLSGKEDYFSENRYIFSEQMYLAVPVGHRFADIGEIDLYEARDEDFVSLMGSKQMRYICDEFCKHAGFKPKVVFESDGPALVQNMIIAGAGIGFWPQFVWGKVDETHIKLVRIKEPVCVRDIVIDCKYNKKDNSEVASFYKFLIEFCEKIIA